VAIPSSSSDSSRSVQNIRKLFSLIPKAELHLHLEGSIEPATAVELAARHRVAITEAEVRHQYAAGDFAKFLDAFKWVTSFLRTPDDYALITERLAEQLLSQNVVYAEVTLSIGVMLLRKQDVLANFAAIRKAAAAYESRGVRMQWVFDAVRQFGASSAAEVVKLASDCVREGVVAFGIGGDELALPAANFRGVYERAGSAGLGRLIHVGEIGNAASVREAVELLDVTRIGHGISAMNDAAVMDFLSEQSVTLELCPTSNIRTGALARQLGRPSASIDEHPLKMFFERGIRVTLSSDDPAMFETTLLDEYGRAANEMGLSADSLARIAEMGFENAFLSDQEKARYLKSLRAVVANIAFPRRGH
jgi:adenosine deaminase/aminodeoxyfutalosine deaminase